MTNLVQWISNAFEKLVDARAVRWLAGRHIERSWNVGIYAEWPGFHEVSAVKGDRTEAEPPLSVHSCVWEREREISTADAPSSFRTVNVCLTSRLEFEPDTLRSTAARWALVASRTPRRANRMIGGTKILHSRYLRHCVSIYLLIVFDSRSDCSVHVQLYHISMSRNALSRGSCSDERRWVTSVLVFSIIGLQTCGLCEK